jgi:hypothetical protein
MNNIPHIVDSGASVMNSNQLADKLENATSISEVARLVKENVIPMLRYQQASIDRLIGAEPITYGMLTFCKNCGQQNPYFEKAQEKCK